MFRGRVAPHILLILLVAITGFSGFFGNVASNQLPKSWQPYLGWAWVPFLILLAAEVVLTVIQAHGSRQMTTSHNTHLDVRILDILLFFLDNHMGNSKMPLGDLIKECGVESSTVLKCLYELKEKQWVDFNLLEQGKSGQVWLTAAGVVVAEDATRQ